MLIDDSSHVFRFWHLFFAFGKYEILYQVFLFIKPPTKEVQIIPKWQKSGMARDCLTIFYSGSCTM